jgi:hypothetical protein
MGDDHQAGNEATGSKSSGELGWAVIMDDGSDDVRVDAKSEPPPPAPVDERMGWMMG